MNTCSICGFPATVHDLDHDVYYCDLHAEERLVCAGNHEHLEALT
jgi:hypothetical protein